MGEILSFPNVNKNIEHRAMCPKCNNDSWHITVDAVKISELKTFRCTECNYEILLTVLFSMINDDE